MPLIGSYSFSLPSSTLRVVPCGVCEAKTARVKAQRGARKLNAAREQVAARTNAFVLRSPNMLTILVCHCSALRTILTVHSHVIHVTYMLTHCTNFPPYISRSNLPVRSLRLQSPPEQLSLPNK